MTDPTCVNCRHLRSEHDGEGTERGCHAQREGFDSLNDMVEEYDCGCHHYEDLRVAHKAELKPAPEFLTAIVRNITTRLGAVREDLEAARFSLPGGADGKALDSAINRLDRMMGGEFIYGGAEPFPTPYDDASDAEWSNELGTPIAFAVWQEPEESDQVGVEDGLLDEMPSVRAEALSQVITQRNALAATPHYTVNRLHDVKLICDVLDETAAGLLALERTIERERTSGNSLEKQEASDAEQSE